MVEVGAAVRADLQDRVWVEMEAGVEQRAERHRIVRQPEARLVEEGGRREVQAEAGAEGRVGNRVSRRQLRLHLRLRQRPLRLRLLDRKPVEVQAEGGVDGVEGAEGRVRNRVCRRRQRGRVGGTLGIWGHIKTSYEG